MIMAQKDFSYQRKQPDSHGILFDYYRGILFNYYLQSNHGAWYTEMATSLEK